MLAVKYNKIDNRKNKLRNADVSVTEAKVRMKLSRVYFKGAILLVYSLLSLMHSYFVHEKEGRKDGNFDIIKIIIQIYQSAVSSLLHHHHQCYFMSCCFQSYRTRPKKCGKPV